MRSVLALLLVWATPKSCVGFAPQSHPGGRNLFDATYAQQLDLQRTNDVSLRAVESAADLVFPGALFIAATAATVVTSGGKDDGVSDASDAGAPAPISVPEPVPPVVVADEVVAEPDSTEIADEAMEASVASGADIAQIRQEVASTIEGEKEKFERLQASTSEDEETETVSETIATDEADDEESSTEVETAPGFFRKLLRVTKKVIAPWRKWENIDI